MSRRRRGPLLAAAAALAVATATTALTSGQNRDVRRPVLQDDPAIQYVSRPTRDRVGTLKAALTGRSQSLEYEPQAGYLRSVLAALNLPVESQLLVFAKTSVQRDYISPRHPRALYFDESVAVGYVPGAPVIELAAQDPQQGIVFYSLEQAPGEPAITRQTSCLACHVSPGTLNVPGMLVRSNTVGEDGNVVPPGSHDVDHRTPHPDRWAGWFVTSDDGSAPRYAQRAHAGNITFSEGGITSSQVFVDWINSSPEAGGYLSSSSDNVALLAFDHQMHAMNLMTRLDWESRVAAARGDAPLSDSGVRGLVNDLTDYLLFVDEAPLSVPLTARASFAERLAARTPKDRRGRSLAQLDLVDRLQRYPCSYMIYTAAFDALPAAVKLAIYERMIGRLSSSDDASRMRVPVDDRRAALEILRDTKPGFPDVSRADGSE